MRKYVIAILLFTGFSFTASADHITGGEMYYTYAGFSNGNHQYNVTLKLFMRCNSGRMFANPNIISVFDKATNARVADYSVPLADQRTISLQDAGPCVSNPPTVCYEVGYYYFTLSLPPSGAGYILASQVNYRIRGINNLDGSLVGATYTCEIPGIFPILTAPENISAVFTGSDLVVVCANNSFSYSFAAQDDDGDQLRYSFCSAYVSSNGGTNGDPPGNPPFTPVPYIDPYKGSSPFGVDVQIDPATGLITGIAPEHGYYVVTVCVEEIRNAVVIATQRKDIQIYVADCNVAAARLQEDYSFCRNSQTIVISNLSTSPLITSYDWSVMNSANSVIHTSSAQTLNYTVPAAGTYSVKLVVNRGQQCSDSATAQVFVYPGFIPDFDFSGICLTKPSAFTDLTSTVTGTVNSWKWDFGETATTADASILQNPIYTYPSLGRKNVRLIVTNTDGCRDEVIKTITIIEKPPLILAFRDTLICINDQVKLQANGMGNFSWSPGVNIVNANTATPTVSPTATTTYYADLNSDGCLNRDSVKVRVVNQVSLQSMSDTIICSGDTIQLRIVSDGLNYLWTPANQLVNATAKDPVAITPATTTYQVTATIGGCAVNAMIMVTAIPYPVANAGADTIICYQTSALLQATTDGTSWQWTPASSLSDPIILNPVASPDNTIYYFFTAYDNTRGCPKPGRDTVLVKVLPKVKAFAGRDTTVVVGQALQLSASGGDSYIWTPANNLSAADMANPVAVFDEPSDGLQYKVNTFNIAGCTDSAFITIKVFATAPTVFVPTAFTPNNDGKNDILRPVAVGMQRIEYFNVYNRWGQLVFSSSINGAGWDGRIGGQVQASNVYIWMVKAIDYRGTFYFQKGMVTLIQ
jgi:gliding motility-associated-like protein